MQDARIYIDGVLVDADQGTVIALNKQIGSIFKPDTRGVNYTRSFNLLLTARTSNVFSNVGQPYNQSLAPYRKIPIKVALYSEEIIVDSHFKIDSVDNIKKTVRGNARSNAISLFDKIKTLKLSDLDFTSINHRYSGSVLRDATENNYSNGYIYLDGNYGVTDVPSNTKYTPPCVYLRWLWEQIFLQNDFEIPTIESEFTPTVLESEHFNTKVITVTKHPVKYGQENFDPEPAVDFSLLFGDITQKDIIDLVIQMYGLYSIKNDFKNSYTLITSNELLSAERDYVDYSNKYKQTNSIKYNSGFSKRNWYKYKYDDDNKSSSDDYFIIDSDFVNENKNIINCKFKAYTGYLQFFDVNTKKEGINVVEVVKPKITTPYILNVNKTTSFASYDFGGLSGKFILDNYYDTFSKVLNRFEVRIAEFELTANDVKNFDFFKLIYIRQEQAYYYCNKLINYVGGKTTKLELIRVSSIYDGVNLGNVVDSTEKPKVCGDYSREYSSDYNRACTGGNNRTRSYSTEYSKQYSN